MIIFFMVHKDSILRLLQEVTVTLVIIMKAMTSVRFEMILCFLAIAQYLSHSISLIQQAILLDKVFEIAENGNKKSRLPG